MCSRPYSVGVASGDTTRFRDRGTGGERRVRPSVERPGCIPAVGGRVGVARSARRDRRRQRRVARPSRRRTGATARAPASACPTSTSATTLRTRSRPRSPGASGPRSPVSCRHPGSSGSPATRPTDSQVFDLLVSSRFDDEGRCVGATVTLSPVEDRPSGAGHRLRDQAAPPVDPDGVARPSAPDVPDGEGRPSVRSCSSRHPRATARAPSWRSGSIRATPSPVAWLQLDPVRQRPGEALG